MNRPVLSVRQVFAVAALCGVFLVPSHVRTAVDSSSESGFPKTGILPKEETGALRFLEKHPEYDGRGVVVAIFDTGVDPGAAGLQTTTDGKPKVIDMIDGTGSGDVDTSKVKPVNDDGTVEGLSGRPLKLDPEWTKGSGKIRVGIKRAYDFFSSEVIQILKHQRREKFEKQHAAVERKLRQKIIQWDRKHPKPDASQKLERADLDEQLKQLGQALTKYADPGPLYDCVVFRDEEKKWRAVVDTDEDGDLTDETALTNFRDERQYATFGEDSFLNFAVNIYEGGNRISIVADTGAHGTHVAGIVAAHLPKQPELNGIAPGAQIVSVKIGDSRIEGMETGAGLVRGLNAVIRNKCDLINMSYGEPSATANRGRLTELFSELVKEHGVIFVASAGNEGPALSTVGAPGGTTSALLGVGAYVSPQMMKVEYTLREDNPGMPYSWTSRGPTLDGDAGVDIFAPGGAIAPVPRWTRQRSMRMNGTSMASPNACGNIALMLSGMKELKRKYSPWSVRRAIQNTAKPIGLSDHGAHPAEENGDYVQPFAQGPGLLQVDAAFEHLKDNANKVGERLEFDVRIPSRDNARGIYLRDAYEANAEFETSVAVRPLPPRKGGRDALNDFEIRLRLQSTADWVDVGENLLLTHSREVLSDRRRASFDVRVDPTCLPRGQVHAAEVLAFDATDPGRGPVFRLPVTVIRTDNEVESRTHIESYRAGRVKRLFLDVPPGATWADVRVQRTDNGSTSIRYMVHTVQAQGGESFEAANTRSFFSLRSTESHTETIAVTPNRTLEVALAQYWSSPGTSLVHVDVTFHGIRPDDNSIALSTSESVARIGLTSQLRLEHLKPTGSLSMRQSTLHPTESKLRPLSAERDRLPDGSIAYELVLTYEFEQKQAGKVTPRFPFNDELLYESPFGTQLWLLFDSAKRRVMTDDVWPDPVSLGKGKHTLKVQLRHSDPKLLERMKSAIVHLDRPLSSSVGLKFYRNRPSATAGTSAFQSATMLPGQRLALYVAAPDHNKVPKGTNQGDVLIGTVRYGATDDAEFGAGQKPGGYPVHYTVEIPVKAKSAATQGEVENTTQLRLAQLRKVDFEKDRKKFDSLAKRLMKQDDNKLEVLRLKLHRLDTLEKRKQRLSAVVKAADDVIAMVDTGKLRSAFGTRANPENEDATKRRKDAEKQKEVLVDALYRKGRGLGYMELPEVIEKHPIEDPKAHSKAFEANFAELRNWVDTTDEKYFLLHVRRERRLGRRGNSLQLLNKFIGSSAPDYWHYKKRRDIYEELGWKHLWEYEKR